MVSLSVLYRCVLSVHTANNGTSNESGMLFAMLFAFYFDAGLGQLSIGLITCVLYCFVSVPLKGQRRVNDLLRLAV